jgi:hypothetical protein
MFRTSLKKIYKLGTPEERAICSDDGSGHSLDTIELGKVLQQGVDVLGVPFDLLGMDACLMSNLEVAYQVRPYVKYIVASEENEPNDGWPYDRVLKRLVDDPDITTADFVRHIVSAYVKSYVDRGYTGPVTQAALDLEHVQELTAPLDQLADVLIPHMETGKYEFSEALFRTKAKFYGQTLWDVAEFCENVGLTTTKEAVKPASQGVRDVLQPNADQFVLAESHNGTKVEKCGGVTLYVPPRILHSVSQYYNELEFAQNHKWLDLLEAYHSE